MLSQSNTDNFIGRGREIEIFEQWLTTPDAPWILYFHDALEEVEKKGGVGKTWLLRRCAALAKQMHRETTIVMIDFFNIADRDGVVVAERLVKDLQSTYPSWVPESFQRSMQEYRRTIDTKNIDMVDIRLRMSDALMTDLQVLEQQIQANNAYLLVCFDTFELIEQNPTIAVLHPTRTFPDNYRFRRIRVVMAGRNKLDWTHLNWRGRQQEVLSVPLLPFSRQEMLQYLDTVSIYSLSHQSEQAEALYERTSGRPILLGLVKDVLNQRILTLEELITIPQTHFEPYLVAQVNKLESPLNWIILFMAHVYHRFNAKQLKYILQALSMQDLVSYSDHARLLALLPTLSFVRYPGYGEDFVLHDETRRMVVKYCWEVQDPDQEMRKEISSYIIRYYEQVISSEQNEQERQPHVIEMLYHLLFVDVVNGFAYFKHAFSRALNLSKYSFARSLLQEVKGFWSLMSPEQRNDLTLLDVKLLRLEGKLAMALDLCLSLELEDNEQWLVEHHAEFLFEKGRSYLALSSLPEAKICLMDSLAIERVNGNERRCAAILSSLGYIHRRNGLFELAVKFYEEAMFLYKKLHSLSDYANMLNNISNVYRIQGKIEEALQRCKIGWLIRYNLFQQSLVPEVAVGLSLGTMGRIYLDANDIVKAEIFFNDAFDIYVRNRYKKGIAAIYNRFGQLQIGKGDLYKAREWFEKAESAALEVDAEAHVQSLNRQGRICSRQNEWEQAVAFFEQAIEFARRIHDHYQRVESLMGLGEVLQQQEKSELSQQAFQAAKEIANRENYTYLLGRIEEAQGNLKYNAGEYRVAFEYYQRYCRYMALYNTLEYNAALRNIINNLFSVSQAEILTITHELTIYWTAQQMEKDYPELMTICKQASELMIF